MTHLSVTRCRKQSLEWRCLSTMYLLTFIASLVEFESNNGPGELFPIEFLAQGTHATYLVNE